LLKSIGTRPDVSGLASLFSLKKDYKFNSIFPLIQAI